MHDSLMRFRRRTIRPCGTSADAVLTAGDDLLKGERRFTLVANRFDWQEAKSADAPFVAIYFTCRLTGVRSERVSVTAFPASTSAKRRGLSLLTLTFETRNDAQRLS